MSESQYDIGYLTEIHKFFVGNGDESEGIAEPEQSTLKLWPNPTSGRFTIEVKEATTMEVIDIQGRCIAKHSLNSGVNQIDLGEASVGMYFIKLGNGEVKKVILRP